MKGLKISSLDMAMDGLEYTRVAGFAGEEYVGSIDLLPGKARAEFRQLFVKPAFRKQGIARQLMGVILTKALVDGTIEIACLCRRENADALRFYSRLGFRTVQIHDEDFILIALIEQVLNALRPWKEAA